MRLVCSAARVASSLQPRSSGCVREAVIPELYVGLRTAKRFVESMRELVQPTFQEPPCHFMFWAKPPCHETVPVWRLLPVAPCVWFVTGDLLLRFATDDVTFGR